MMQLRNLYVSTAKWHGPIVILVFALLLVSWPANATPEREEPAVVVPTLGPDVAYPRSMLAKRGKGLDRGTFELLQMGPLPTAWVWVEDDTTDGQGVEVWAIHASFVSPGPQNPSVDLTYEYQPGVNHTTRTDFVNWIIASYPHVNSPGDLLVYRVDAGP